MSRITSGVKLINLDEGVTEVAQIAKVREKLSNGDHEFDNLEEAMEENLISLPKILKMNK